MGKKHTSVREIRLHGAHQNLTTYTAYEQYTHAASLVSRAVQIVDAGHHPGAGGEARASGLLIEQAVSAVSSEQP